MTKLKDMTKLTHKTAKDKSVKKFTDSRNYYTKQVIYRIPLQIFLINELELPRVNQGYDKIL